MSLKGAVPVIATFSLVLPTAGLAVDFNLTMTAQGFERLTVQEEFSGFQWRTASPGGIFEGDVDATWTSGPGEQVIFIDAQDTGCGHYDLTCYDDQADGSTVSCTSYQVIKRIVLKAHKRCVLLGSHRCCSGEYEAKI